MNETGLHLLGFPRLYASLVRSFIILSALYFGYPTPYRETSCIPSYARSHRTTCL